jgi:predicted AAA+ superfamily ATPase
MKTKEELLQIAQSQQEAFSFRRCIDRDVSIPTTTKKVVVVSGIRRCGKSTLIEKSFLKEDNALYLNFEDPRMVNFDLNDFMKVETMLKEQKKKYLLLDEMQNVEQWELYVRSANERGIPLVITGSNASLLSRELGTKLTGRYVQLELFPFDFQEFCRFFKKDLSLKSFEKYFEMGGFPEFLEENDENYLRLLLRDIVTRDIALRKNIFNNTQLMRLAVFLMSNIGKEVSYNNISKTLEIKSVRTVIDYCDYLHESYLVDFIPLYSPSIKKQIVNPKKTYAVDHAFSQANSLSFSKDLGRRLENIVYMKLRYSGNAIYYYRNDKAKCDFVVKEKEVVTTAVQVCYEVNSDNMKRELNGIKAALVETNAKNGVIVTFNQKDELDGIPLVPAWEWLQWKDF